MGSGEDLLNKTNKTCNISEILHNLNYSDFVSSNNTVTVHSVHTEEEELRRIMDNSSFTETMNGINEETISKQQASEKYSEHKSQQDYLYDSDKDASTTTDSKSENSKETQTSTETETQEQESIKINLNQSESSPLLSMKSPEDLKLSIDLNNTRLNETMGSEEFLMKMMEVTKKSNLKAEYK
mmetsp:Transcript_37720/g.39189  ORF Transcript_37720/g.39189 Transcript_37720/m.39189 type:complete len:183 (+) Transcript_37720:326-874(+)